MEHQHPNPACHSIEGSCVDILIEHLGQPSSEGFCSTEVPHRAAVEPFQDSTTRVLLSFHSVVGQS